MNAMNLWVCKLLVAQAIILLLAITCSLPIVGVRAQANPKEADTDTLRVHYGPRDSSTNSAREPALNTTVSPTLPFLNGGQVPPKILPGLAPGRPLSPTESAVRNALSMPGKDLEPCRFVRIELPGDQQAKASDYYPMLIHDMHGKVAHFTAMPIPVYFQPLPAPLMQFCVAALDMWEFRSQGLVRFVQVGDPSQARIKVCWQHLGASANETSDGAVTQLRWNSQKGRGSPLAGGGRSITYVAAPQVVNVNLDVLGTRPAEDQGILLRNVLAHEIGHALGIQTHSPQEGDLMYTETDEYSRISERDLNTLRKLYQTPSNLQL
jgi:hypothetical protein